MGQGRPTKYKPEYDEKLVIHMAQGLSFEAFAGDIDVNQDTLHEWVKVHPSFSEAKKRAFAKCQIFWERIGIRGLFVEKGEAPLNTGVWVFNMKNRFKWTDRISVDAPPERERDFIDTSDDELDKLIEGE